ncbi:MAG TPA: methyltransferase domain-containing protein [Streptosporangiaceae bacterium]|jgi:ubiquinone/menaquinone biosynthesis C-methylase UbiE|nr:methyltransferase domain-containing protein [Streptosporangiaceae bacterium]
MRPDSFAARAATYSNSVWHAELAEAFVRWLALGPGLTVVDVGTGTGFAALAVDGAARRRADGAAEAQGDGVQADGTRAAGPQVGGADGVRVQGVDLSPAMIEVARERAAAAGRAGAVAFAVGDGHRLGLRDQSVDAVLFVTSLQYMEAARALGEARRIVRPGGTVAIATLEAGTMAPSVLYRRLLAEHGVETPDRMGAFGHPDRLIALLEEAGLSDAETGQDVLRLADADLAEAWRVSSTMYARRLAGMAGPDLATLRHRYEAQVADALATDEDGFRTITMLMARARRPDR